MLDLSGKIDPQLLALFAAVDQVASDRNIDYFVLGATARDLILSYGYGIQVGRATVDVDLGVETADWDSFTGLKDGLIETGLFEATGTAQRLRFRSGMPVDIVPFGAIARPYGEFGWPPDGAVRMNVHGFDDAHHHRQKVRLRSDPSLEIPLATPAGLVLLKLIAWKDRRPDGAKDTGDLVLLLRNYLDVGNHERLVAEHPDLLDDDFDYERSGARLLGRDLAGILSPETREVVLMILERETGDNDRYPLAEDMMEQLQATDDPLGYSLALLEAVKMGILDEVQ